MKRKNIVFKALTCGLATLAFTACTDTWDSHYQPKPELNATETLWELIEADPELSKFAEFAKATGYDEVLSQNRFYTVWAPVNDAEFFVGKENLNWAEVGDSMINVYKFEFVENHIADYNHTATGTMTKNLVKMLNGKYNGFNGTAGDYTFKNAAVAQANIAAKNGLLHKTTDNAIFTANIWEQLDKEEGISHLNTFLKSFNKIEFDRYSSVEGPRVNGQVTYLDSVFVENNQWFGRIGRLNREDSSYIMFAPTNKAWEEIYAKAKTYFVYDESVADRDSLQDAITKDFLVRHLVFSNTLQKSPTDSLVSYYNGYYRPLVFKGEDLEKLYANLVDTKELSNGTLNIVDSYNYTTFWHDTLRVQGESLLGDAEGAEVPEYKQAIKSYASISKDSIDKYYQTSNGSIGVYGPSTPTGNPTLIYTLKNTLSAKYRIKLVLAPADFVNWRDTVLLPNKFNATLSYKDIAGKKKSVDVGKNLIYTPTRAKLDTITLIPATAAEGEDYFTFAANEYNLTSQETTITQLQIQGKVSARESGFDRTIRVEQVFLEPVTEE